nr:reverse transcriptase domain-containing protein [Tanacetum cinerariifolium]
GDPGDPSLTGFSGETTWPLGQLKLLVTIGDATNSTKAWMNFMIVKSLSPYNGIIGRPRNLDIFAWKPSDMTGVPRSVAEHRLDVREGCPPVRQKKRGQAPERTKAIQAEHSPDDRTGDGTDASLPYKPCVTGPGTKLLPDGKAGVITSLCSKKASKIFLGTSYREHNITYRPRTSIKGQILADFLNEMPSSASQSASVEETQEEPWTLFTDGSSCVDGSSAGLILTNPDGVEFTYALRFQFAASNNKAEYEALIAGLRIATQIGVKTYKQMLILNW